MVSKINTVVFLGTELVKVEVQVQISNGYPALTIVGMPNQTISESKERIIAAIKSLGLTIPNKKIIVNLSPVDLRKDGNHFDLPIAVAILCAIKVLDENKLQDCIVMGELSLDANILPVNGILVAALECLMRNTKLICPYENSSEVSIIKDDLTTIAPKNLLDLINYFKGISSCEIKKTVEQERTQQSINFDEIYGQHNAKRAMIIAIAGEHNILLSGQPGTGKSMLAASAVNLLPEITTKEMLEINSIQSIAGLLKGNLLKQRPYRAPHSSASMAGMIGGGNKCKPGEISLAHGGVLFLDEMPEFATSILDSLRQPMETGTITLVRADKTIHYPAKFQLIAAMNPCKCGYFKDLKKQCHKAPICAKNYTSKITGPILDRIDLYVEVDNDDIATFLQKKSESKDDTYQDIKQNIASARLIQQKRYKDKGIYTNNQLNNKLIERYCQISDKSNEAIKKYSKQFNLSMRGYSKVLKVCRTIADLEDSENIKYSHVLEALHYRMRD